jgi:WD40 repeat protein
MLSEKTKAHSSVVVSVAFSPDGTKIVSGSGDGTIKVWDSGALRPQIAPSWPKLTPVGLPGRQAGDAEREDERTQRHHQVGGVFPGRDQDCVRIARWDDQSLGFGCAASSNSPLLGQNWRLLACLADKLEMLSEKTNAHSDTIRSVAFSPADGTKIVSGSYDKTIKVWDSGAPESSKLPLLGQNWRLLACLADKLELLSEKTDAHSSYITLVAFSPDGTKIVSGSDDKTIKVWDFGAPKPRIAPPWPRLMLFGLPGRHTGAVEREDERP